MSHEEYIFAAQEKAFYSIERLPSELCLEIYQYLGLFPQIPREKQRAAHRRETSLDANSDVCGMEPLIIKQLTRLHKSRTSTGLQKILHYYYWHATFAAYIYDQRSTKTFRSWLSNIGDARDPATGFGVSCIRDIVFWTGVEIVPSRVYDRYVRIRILLDEKDSTFTVTTNALSYQTGRLDRTLGRILTALDAYLQTLVQVRRVGMFLLCDWQAILNILENGEEA